MLYSINDIGKHNYSHNNKSVIIKPIHEIIISKVYVIFKRIYLRIEITKNTHLSKCVFMWRSSDNLECFNTTTISLIVV